MDPAKNARVPIIAAFAFRYILVLYGVQGCPYLSQTFTTVMVNNARAADHTPRAFGCLEATTQALVSAYTQRHDASSHTCKKTYNRHTHACICNPSVHTCNMGAHMTAGIAMKHVARCSSAPSTDDEGSIVSICRSRWVCSGGNGIQDIIRAHCG